METNGLIWSRLRQWVDEKEDYERKTGEPAPLTSKERVAIRALLPNLAGDLENEPSMGKEDWVSQLLRMLIPPPCVF